ncbi:NmrA family NAD(P)-binding protein [Nostoc sp.]|uniref:NmrA family NAD(P)-binding protein n=1 Tax=Nostoc sp. TaxID=1180 RepID=UPI002FF7DAC4
MYAITGITGQVGSAVAHKLLTENQCVRAVVRDLNKGTAWAEQGCAVALAPMNDADALKAAFAGAEGVFVVLPPNFAPSRGFPETRAIDRRPAYRTRGGASGQGRLPIHNWGAGNPAEPAHSTSDHGAGTGGICQCRSPFSVRPGSWRTSSQTAITIQNSRIQNSNILDIFRRSRSVSQRRGVRSWGLPKRSNSGEFKPRLKLGLPLWLGS